MLKVIYTLDSEVENELKPPNSEKKKGFSTSEKAQISSQGNKFY